MQDLELCRTILFVKDMAKMVEFYRDSLGLVETISVVLPVLPRFCCKFSPGIFIQVRYAQARGSIPLTL